MIEIKKFNRIDKNQSHVKFIRDGRAPIPDKEITSKLMSANKARNTKPEIQFRKALWKNGIRGYRLHWKKIPGSPDIAFPGKRIAIFINGCFWHRCPNCKPPMPKSHSTFWRNKFSKNVLRDKKKIKLLTQSDWETLVVWECQVKNDLRDSINRTKKILGLKAQ